MKLDRIIAVRNKKTIFRDGNLCIKVFNENYSKSEIFSEAMNRTIIEETGLNVPKVLEVTKVDGKWAIVLENIKGKSLAQLIKENPDKKDEYITMMADIHMEILTKNSPQLARMKDKMTQGIIRCELDANTRYDLHTRLESMPKQSKLCHGDFMPSNIIITDEGVKYILDWENATQGNISSDIAKTYLRFCADEDQSAADTYLTSMCEKSGVTKETIEKWLPLVAAAMSVEGNETYRDFMLSVVKSSKY